MMLNLMTEELRMWGSAGSGGCGKERHPHPHHTHGQQPSAEHTHCLLPEASVGPEKGAGGGGVFCSELQTPLL